MNAMDFDALPDREELQGVLRRAVDGIRADPPPAAQVDAWQRRYSQTVASLDPQWAAVPTRRRTVLRRVVTISAAAALLIAASVVLSYLTSATDGGKTYADVLAAVKHMEGISTATWTVTIYGKMTSKDGKRRWIQTETDRCAYKTPGLIREVRIRDGEDEWTRIRDTVNGKKLHLSPGAKKATIVHLGREELVTRNPLSRLARDMRGDLTWLGTKVISGRNVNGFRALRIGYLPRGKTEIWSADFWVDVKTKQLVLAQIPAAHLFDPAQDPDSKNPVQPWESGATGTHMGTIWHNIAYDVELEDSLFSFDIPDDYEIETVRRAEVTEKDVIEWLRLWAEYFGSTFPDGETARIGSVDVVNKIIKKKKEDRSSAEQKILEHFFSGDGAYEMPINRFIQHTARADSWVYLGKGVKLGDKERVVCWYGLTDSNIYRVIYGDLGVKDVTAEDLPLPVEP